MGENTKQVRRAIVLSGGGARGAYEVGVLKYIFKTLGPARQIEPRFDIISGSSVGAINGCFMASRADRHDYDIRALERTWVDLRIREYLHIQYREVVLVLQSLFGRGLTRGLGIFAKQLMRPHSGGRLGGILNTSSLDKLVRSYLRHGKIRDNIEDGHLHALTVSATAVATGRTITFIDTCNPPLSWTNDPRRRARVTEIGADHALASAAIPFLFPAVPVDDEFYCDGSLRQNTPLSPALRLGADRVLVVSLRHDAVQPIVAPKHAYPNALFLLGKVFNALLLDPIQYDLGVLERINQILKHGREVYGESFDDELAEVVVPLRGTAYRFIDDLLIKPSVDIGVLAAEISARIPSSHWGRGPLSRLMKRLVRSEDRLEADLLSHLFFDGVFSQHLIDMGYQDAARKANQLAAFFSDDPYPY